MGGRGGVGGWHYIFLIYDFTPHSTTWTPRIDSVVKWPRHDATLEGGGFFERGGGGLKERGGLLIFLTFLTCAKKNQKNEPGTKMFRIRHECEKSLVTNCSLSAVSTTKWLSYDRIERRSTMSCYYGSKIFGSQQSFLTETVICIVERCKKNMDYCFVPECNHAKESHESQFFRFFFVRHICRTTVCWDPETLLPWQRDAVTSPPYSRTRKLNGWFSLWRNFCVRTHVKFTRVN